MCPTKGITTDPQRLTSLVLLSVQNDKTFPLIFYRDNCADSALCEDDVSEDFILSARALLVTGTHFAREVNDKAQRKAMAIAKKHGRKIAIDIDYRPNLWGLAGHAAGEERYIKSDKGDGPYPVGAGAIAISSSARKKKCTSQAAPKIRWPL